MSVTREFRRDDGVTVITESGVAGGPCFVLVHGIGMGHRYWSDLADALARTGRVLALDLPGFGDAPEPEHPHSMPESGDYLAALLEGEDLHDVVLVGHSMGAQIVAETAARHPERVGGVVLIAPTVNPRERSATMQALRLLQDESISKPKVLGLALLSYVQAGPRWYFAKLAPHGRPPRRGRPAERRRAGPGDPRRGRPHLAARLGSGGLAARCPPAATSRCPTAGTRRWSRPASTWPGSWTRTPAATPWASTCACPPSRSRCRWPLASPGGPPTTRTRVCDSWRCSRRHGRRSGAAGLRRPAGGRDRPNCPRSCCCRASTSTGRSCVRSATR